MKMTIVLPIDILWNIHVTDKDFISTSTEPILTGFLTSPQLIVILLTPFIESLLG